MRVTKIMKDHVLEKLNEKRKAINEEAEASYIARKKACAAMIKEYLQNEVYPKVEAILESHDMDVTCFNTSGELVRSKVEEIIYFRNGYIANHSESCKLDEERRARLRLQNILYKQFLLECDLGVDKEQFFSMVDELVKSL